MRKVAFLTLLVGAAALSGVGFLSAGHADFPSLEKIKFEAKDLQRGTLAVSKKDVDVTLKGRVRQDWIGYDKVYTLRASNDDQLSGFRTKACIDFIATYGKQTFGRSAADAKLRWSSYGFWKGEGFYTPFTATTGDRARNSQTINLLAYVEDAWVNLHFGTFWDAYDNWFNFRKHPVSVKIGYFEYQLGRGIALGDFPMHIPYLGWESYEYDGTRSNHPGILIHGFINKDISYDFYYSKQEERSLSRSHTWVGVHENQTDCRRKWRGISKDRDLWALRMDFKHDKRWGSLNLQPYMLYIDAPELKVETEADSCARLGTCGLMAHFKRGNFHVNAEIAGQFGHQYMHAIDRNVDNSHIFADSAISGDSAPSTISAAYDCHSDFPASSLNGDKVGEVASRELVGLVVLDQDLGVAGEITIDHADFPEPDYDFLVHNFGDPDDPPTTTEYFNSNIAGNTRFRDSYRVDLRGYMAMIDAKYQFEDVPVTIAGTATYISGDKYPFNTECDKRYRAFIPYGDYNYVGEYVISQILLDARKLPRPTDFIYQLQYAENNIKDSSNLAYIGLSAEWRPFKNKKKLFLKSNILWFWQPAHYKRWDKHASAPEPFASHGWNSEEWTKGWLSCDNASRVLGTELNFESLYRPVANCIFLMQFACFIPGQLYKDLDGQPNQRTKSGPQAKDYANYGLGHDPVWRLAFSLDYRF